MKRLFASLLLLGAAAACADAPEPVAPEPAGPAQAALGRGAAGSGFVATPAGLYRRECVHEVPDGSHVDRGGRVRRRDGTTFQLPWCSRPDSPPGRPADEEPEVQAPVNTGWIEYGHYYTGANFSRLTANWTTPAKPTGTYSGTQLYYSFPGIQSDEYIIQPVIQYGHNGGFGSTTNWTGASWHCNDGSNCTHSSPISFLAGDPVYGSIAATGCANGVCTWTIILGNARTGVSTTRTISDTQNYYWAFGGAVEVYGLTSCSQYPRPSINYSGIALYNAAGTQITPSWSHYVEPGLDPFCGFAVSSTSTSVTLTHNPPPPPPPTVSSVYTNPSPAKQYLPFSITINGSGFDPNTVEVRLLGGTSCPSPGCTPTSYTTKTSTQLVINPFSLSMPGTMTVNVRNGPTGTWSTNSHTITVAPMY